MQIARDRVISQLNDRDWDGPFWFVVGADTQLGLIDKQVSNKPPFNSNTGTASNSVISWQEELSRISKCVNWINSRKNKPKFVIVCGDLIDAFPNDPQRSQQISDWKAHFSSISVPLICVCGNHDIGNSPTPAAIGEYIREFGEDYFQFWVSGTKHIVLNSQFFADSSRCPEESKSHDHWLDETLQPDRCAVHTIAYQHIAPFLRARDEPQQYFNLQVQSREKLLTKLSRAGVSKLFCGHYHQNAGGWATSDLEVVVTTAIGCQLGNDSNVPGLETSWSKPAGSPGIRIVQVSRSSISHNFIKLSNLTDDLEIC